jgi:hypothetical protein
MTATLKLYLCGALLTVAALSGVKLPSLSQVRAVNPVAESWARMADVLKQAENSAEGR